MILSPCEDGCRYQRGMSHHILGKDRGERTSIPNLFGRGGHKIILDVVVAEVLI